jgi:hypothetical protein
MHEALTGLEIHNRCERVCLQACAAHQHTVDIDLGHQTFDIVGADAASIKDSEGFGGFRAELFPGKLANELVNFSGNLRSGGSTGPNGPNGLVGQHYTRKVLSCQPVEPVLKLLVDDRKGLVRFALSQHFAEANNRTQAGLEDGSNFSVHRCISFPKEVASFRMADDAIAAAKIRQHQCRNFSRKGSLLFPVAILSGNADVAALSRPHRLTERCIRRSNHNVAMSGVSNLWLELLEELNGLADRLEHLPIAHHYGTPHRQPGLRQREGTKLKIEDRQKEFMASPRF